MIPHHSASSIPLQIRRDYRKECSCLPHFPNRHTICPMHQ
jgi:hypothetical protein